MADLLIDIIILFLIFQVVNRKISYIQLIIFSLFGLITVSIIRYYYTTREDNFSSLYWAIGFVFYSFLLYYRSRKIGISISDPIISSERVVSKPLSWNVISFFLIIFWPLGLLSLFGKIEVDKPNINRKCKAVVYASYALFGLSFMQVIMAYPDFKESLISIVFYLIGGIITYRTAKKIINGVIVD